eukprot:CAMPEP_0177606396 /NCGR_PEP_ID=MMETSP0419_2-20121207/17284_1 /TAXON_ID=582737 /ORGANISM="Tetraselmis sp., Strain GSL018" /LENGTH=71 /DNA_ID=CAMNT_0019100753 /DNA_START=40 /DNA_END=257 /DNA_ORIENTATION=+
MEQGPQEAAAPPPRARQAAAAAALPHVLPAAPQPQPEARARPGRAQRLVSDDHGVTPDGDMIALKWDFELA